MTNLPILFAVTLIVVAVTLVVVGIYIIVVLNDLRKTLGRVNKAIEKSPEKAGLIKANIVEAINTKPSQQPLSIKKSSDKKRVYVRKTDPKQFRGL